jgi:hypothetical protein
VGVVVLGSSRAHRPAHGEKWRERRREEGVRRPACMAELRRGGALAQMATGLTGVRVDNGGAAGGDLRRKWREVRRPVIGARGGESQQRLPRDGWRRRARTATMACGFGPGAVMRRPDTAARRATASGGAERGVRTGAVGFGQRRRPPVGALWRGCARPCRPSAACGTLGGDSMLTSRPVRRERG